MDKDNILSVAIDEQGQLHIKPETTQYNLIYRSATEVHWDASKRTLYSPKPRDWTYIQWYKYIIDIVRQEHGVQLELTDKTIWSDSISDKLKAEIQAL